MAISRSWEIHTYDPENQQWSVQPVKGEKEAMRRYADEIQAEHPTWGVKVCLPDAER